MPNEPRIRAGRLESGDEILVIKHGNDLAIATMKRDSIVAVVLGVEKVAPPEGSERSGYRIRTDRGVIPFATGVSAFTRATEADWKRTRKTEREAKREPVPAPAALDGVFMSEADRAAAVKPKAAPRPAATAAARTPATPAPTPPPAARQVAPEAAAAVESVRALTITVKGAAAVANFQAQARASTTEGARAFWQAKVTEAMKG